MTDLLEFTSDPDETPQQISTLICAVGGGPFDAGGISGSIAQTIGEGELIASFDPDLIFDFRSERPMITFENGAMTRMSDPRLDVYVVEDIEGQKMLVLRGNEPDLRWHSLAEGILQLATQFGVERFYAIGGLPSGIPHTRPVDLLVRGYKKTQPEQDATYIQSVNFSEFLVYTLGTSGIETSSVLARVPFYLVNSVYAAAAGAVATFVADDSGLALPVGDLERIAQTETDQIEAVYGQQEDFRSLVSSLEEDYDTEGPTSGFVIPNDQISEIPTADEIGAAAEQFLARRTDKPKRRRGRHARRDDE
ncbi:PAC2 family protein [Flaviflexus equikiangi]|uniref:PAC2 family protein n=1 Tax=Flaviflexus equikiangi TaxID=2758573 RepID=A0ABS2TFJ5_9ACTO|nr:PAC2 family protein [Flaviflexus equikiangi]MBM9433143.1 PAC2 family protein [Flaviflexus equikiangi]